MKYKYKKRNRKKRTQSSYAQVTNKCQTLVFIPFDRPYMISLNYVSIQDFLTCSSIQNLQL